jgi:hypothetical protein
LGGHLVHSLRYEIRHHYIAMFIAYKAVFIRRLATKQNFESGNRVRRCTPGVAEPLGSGRMGGLACCGKSLGMIILVIP